MSKTLEKREVERSVYVYRCDRCGSEIPESARFGVSRPGEGAQITSRGDEKWEPLLIPTDDDQYALAQASNIDLCQACLESLRFWVRRPSASIQEKRPHS